MDTRQTQKRFYTVQFAHIEIRLNMCRLLPADLRTGHNADIELGVVVHDIDHGISLYDSGENFNSSNDG